MSWHQIAYLFVRPKSTFPIKHKQASNDYRFFAKNTQINTSPAVQWQKWLYHIAKENWTTAWIQQMISVHGKMRQTRPTLSATASHINSKHFMIANYVFSCKLYEESIPEISHLWWQLMKKSTKTLQTTMITRMNFRLTQSHMDGINLFDCLSNFCHWWPEAGIVLKTFNSKVSYLVSLFGRKFPFQPGVHYIFQLASVCQIRFSPVNKYLFPTWTFHVDCT